jgi:hypothetical protein
MSRVEAATEQSRLLDGQSGHPSGSAGEIGYTHQNVEQDEHDVPLAEEASTMGLLTVMAAIWMGVFFAALGM